MDQTVQFRRRLLKGKKQAFAILSLLLVVLVIVFIYWPKGKNLNQNSTIPSWREIIPGKTTKQEVIQIMGQPDDVFKCEVRLQGLVRTILDCFGSHLAYRYEEKQGNRFPAIHEIHLKSERVWYIIEDIRARSDYEQISIEDFVEQYGFPEKVTWSGLSPFLNAVLFCEHGLIVHANTNRVEKVFYFEPMSLNQCLSSFSNEVATENPFADSDIIKAEDPWGFNQQ